MLMNSPLSGNLALPMEDGPFTLRIIKSILSPCQEGWGNVPLEVWGSRKWAERFLESDWKHPEFTPFDVIWDLFIWNLAIKTIYYYRPSQYVYVVHYADAGGLPPVSLLFGWSKRPQRCKYLVDLPEEKAFTAFYDTSRAQMELITERFLQLLHFLDREACLGNLRTSDLIGQVRNEPFFREEFSEKPGSLSNDFLTCLNKKEVL